MDNPQEQIELLKLAGTIMVVVVILCITAWSFCRRWA